MATIHQQQQMAGLNSDFYVPESVYENSVVGIGYSENPLAMSMPMSAISSTSPDSQAVAERKRHYSNEMMEKTIERRQKRMIKNRESAARSRARKQESGETLIFSSNPNAQISSTAYQLGYLLTFS
ncbi:Abscisic acid-insensitive 5-like protein 2 [Quillaja saponaria]|uniref:Abscisic acid-insensitive 5-like protein 2 n=1 Tax=Quillaja saponaria TaxID=32244 RepID=A0AAD7PRW3_QUISA|nr:Abscisic acid-insensitive 5-like protein 2 [Quillaja saponaria]